MACEFSCRRGSSVLLGGGPGRVFLILNLLLTAPALAQQGQKPNTSSGPVPLPRVRAVLLPYDQVSFQVDGKELIRYHYGQALNRPFIYPVNGPSSGYSLTAMGTPNDPEEHSHHSSLWISHQSVNGVDFWEDPNTVGSGKILHKRHERMTQGADSSSILTTNAWLGPDGTALIKEMRRIELQLLKDGEYVIVLDLKLEAREKPVTLGQSIFGILGARMANVADVKKGAGIIRNSEGATNESEVLGKHARWVDYSTAMTSEITEGITIFDHPSNPNYPSPFTVRDTGWMGPALTQDVSLTIPQSKPLRLRYGVYVHRGTPSATEIQKHWEEFVAPPLPELIPKPSSYPELRTPRF